MNERQMRLLQAVIDNFIATAIPVGSQRLLDSGEFRLSSATIRNEMCLLEDLGFLSQPHISAGRIPTARGYQAYVRGFMEPDKKQKKVKERFDVLKEQYFQRKDQERAFEAVSLLSHMIPNVAFATVPHKDRVYYMGLANVLRQPECRENPMLATGIAEVLEENLTDLLSQTELDEKIRYYIGEENVLEQIQSCAIIVTKYSLRGEEGAIGILGPMRMDYAYNTVSLELVADMLNG